MIKSKFKQDVLRLFLDGDSEGEHVKGRLDFISETELDYTGVGVFVPFEHTEEIEKFKAAKFDWILNVASSH